MSHLFKIYGVYKSSYLCLWYLKSEVKGENFYFKCRSLYEWVSSSRDANRRSFNLSPLKNAKNVYTHRP